MNEKKVQQFLSRSARIGRRRRRIRRRRRRRGRRGRRRRRNQQSLHLPEEIIEEILSRLAVKSLLRLRCVSKTWRSLIGSKRFIKAHHQNSMKNPCFPHQRFIIREMSNDRLEECSLQSLLSEPPISRYSLDDALATLLPYQILGCCNGLFCVLKKSRKRATIVYLWNPSTRTSKKLPEISSPGNVRNYGFGWVESSDEYKVFVVVENFHIYNSKRVVKVYSSKTKSWKTIELSGYLRLSWGGGVFAGGKLYWRNSINLYKEEINSLDLKSEVFGRIELPFDHEFCRKWYWFVGVLGGLLCVLCHIEFNSNVVRVWVMKESWKRVATFAHLVELLQPAPLLVGRKGQILLNCGSTLLVYDCGDNVFRRRDEVCYQSRVYVESLVSPEDL
ncbi:F-box/kelch-repeat protein At3g23880-like [Salvia miltiorrhiza]|uniref:F-box/kelch-repeat protein At3g23880-like n=1 Tax=Salvia miltiorrhiza TaxID=226208 RepID=UPI0025AD405B|nr:F-box/kelch-repeat protein At3g23880-like [Salvia miltiorrhiza]